MTPRTFLLVFEAGDKVMEGLLELARRESVGGATLQGIGAFEEATLAFFDLVTKQYEEIPVTEQTEVLSLLGNIGIHEGEPRVHAHTVLGTRHGGTLGGHLLGGVVRPTLEVFVAETGRNLARTMDAETGLPLIDPRL